MRGRPVAAVDFRLYLITNRHALPAGRSLEDAVRAALAGGVQAVQLREKDLSAGDLLPLAERLRQLTREAGARLLINDRIDIALAVEADGVHLGGHSIPAAVARRLLGPQRLIGVSTHHLDEIVAATDADFVTFGPVFPTPSKARFGPPQGLDRLQRACATGLPVFALGGINGTNAAAVLAAGAHGLALISAVQNAADPTAAAQALRHYLPPT